MYFIGITGGVGAGKSTVLDYFSSLPDTRVLLADELAHDLMEPGTDCWCRLKGEFPDESLYLPDGHFNKKNLADLIFARNDTRDRFNEIVHPAVKRYIVELADRLRREGKIRLLVLEAALLIEEHYDRICDELWYIYTSEENRRQRLKNSRGYSDAKVDAIFASQLSEAEFRKACAAEIDNNGSPEDTRLQIHELLLARFPMCGL